MPSGKTQSSGFYSYPSFGDEDIRAQRGERLVQSQTISKQRAGDRSLLVSTPKQKSCHLELSHTSHLLLEMSIKLSQELLVQYAQAVPTSGLSVLVLPGPIHLGLPDQKTGSS